MISYRENSMYERISFAQYSTQYYLHVLIIILLYLNNYFINMNCYFNIKRNTLFLLVRYLRIYYCYSIYLHVI